MGTKDLKFIGIGIDSWGRPVYKDSIKGRIWKDITCGSSCPEFYSASNNEVDGEPDMPITHYYPNFYKTGS